MSQYELDKQWISFSLLKEVYALPVLTVREIIPFRSPALIPGASPEVQGALDVRGDIVTVFSMQALLNHVAAPASEGRIILIDVEGGVFGLCVDAMGDIFTPDPSAIDRNLSPVSSELTIGTVHHGNELVILIDATRISGRLTL